MTKLMKQQLFNDILTGLLVAATFASVVPVEALAQLSTAVDNTSSQVFNPAMRLLGYGAYGVGAVLIVSGIAHVKKHADSPGNTPLTGGIGKLGAGAAFLAAPTVIGMLATTGTSTTNAGTGTATTIQGFGG